MFLAINGFLLKVEPAEAVNTMMALATGELAERGGLGALPHEPSLQEGELDLASWIEKFILKDTLRYRQSLSVVLVDS